MKNKPLSDINGEVRELTEDDLARAVPVSEGLPDLVQAQRTGMLTTKAIGRPKSKNPKQATSIRFSSEVLDHFKSTGKGWQGRIDSVLKEYVQSHQ